MVHVVLMLIFADDLIILLIICYRCVALAIFNVILVWAGMGFYSGVAVGTSDFCVNPTGYLLNPEGKISKIPSQGKLSYREII